MTSSLVLDALASIWLLLVAVWLSVEFVLKLVAIGTVPEGRRPSSSSAWLLLILFVPVVGFPAYWLIGSPWVRGRRHRVQAAANERITARVADLPALPTGADPGPALASVVAMNRRLTGLPCVPGRAVAVHGDTAETFEAMAAVIRGARERVHVEFYIVAWDDTTDPVLRALADAVARGVRVRLLLDHLGSRAYPGWRRLGDRLDGIGVDWRLMMPIQPMRRRWRRPDLRNHRKLLVVDGVRAFVGSHNLIEDTYGSSRNVRTGRRWRDLTVEVGGPVVATLEAVFATDWYTESGELLDLADPPSGPDEVGVDGADAMQAVPSGPGFPTEPNLRLFTSLVHQAVDSVAITSPYFVPDESLLAAITTAAMRGVRVELFVGERADQFLVGHAQRSYYTALLEAGVVIHLHPAPTVLHAKYLTVDGRVGAIGSSNMDFRSFGLTYELTLLAFGGDLVAALRRNDEGYRAVSRVLTLDEWGGQPWHRRYVDNVCRLTSSLM